MWRLGFARLFRRWLQRAEGVPADGGYPAATSPQDAIAASASTAPTSSAGCCGRSRGATELPVQLVVATRDHYVTPRLSDDVDQWAPDLTRRDVDAGHWCARTHPDELAELIAELVDAVDARRPRRPARRSRSA